jgi:hypothetical protein
VVSKFFHTLLWNWPWALVLWGIFSTVFRIADLMVARPATMGGEIVFMMSCSLVAAFFCGANRFLRQACCREDQIAVWPPVAWFPPSQVIGDSSNRPRRQQREVVSQQADHNRGVHLAIPSCPGDATVPAHRSIARTGDLPKL